MFVAFESVAKASASFVHISQRAPSVSLEEKIRRNAGVSGILSGALLEFIHLITEARKSPR